MRPVHERLGDIMQVLLLLGSLIVAQGRKEAWAKNRAKQEEMEMKAGWTPLAGLLVGSDDASGDLGKVGVNHTIGGLGRGDIGDSGPRRWNDASKITRAGC